MTKTVVKTQPSILYQELKEQKQLEAFIAKKISPNLLDYMFLFAPDVSYEVSIKNISAEGIEALKNYIKSADRLMNKFGLKPDPESKDILETFISRLHDMYYMRFIDSRTIYKEYELFRIPTQFELQLEKSSRGAYFVQKESISLIIPDIFIYDESGGIDWIKTIKSEDTEHKIARYISALKNAERLTQQMFYDLEAITTRAFAFMIIDIELKDLIKEVLIDVFYFFSGEVYKYINRSYGLEESVQNVYELYKPYAEGGKAAFMKELKPLFDDVHKVINTAFDNIKEMNKPTREMLIDDFDELIRGYFIYKMVFPKDYYKVIRRGPDEFYESEKNQNYEMMLDLHMFIPEGGITDVALETFYVDLSDESKFLIFKSVVGEVENPMFTLKKYLRLK